MQDLIQCDNHRAELEMATDAIRMMNQALDEQHNMIALLTIKNTNMREAYEMCSVDRDSAVTAAVSHAKQAKRAKRQRNWSLVGMLALGIFLFVN